MQTQVAALGVMVAGGSRGRMPAGGAAAAHRAPAAGNDYDGSAHTAGASTHHTPDAGPGAGHRDAVARLSAGSPLFLRRGG